MTEVETKKLKPLVKQGFTIEFSFYTGMALELVHRTSMTVITMDQNFLHIFPQYFYEIIKKLICCLTYFPTNPSSEVIKVQLLDSK